MSSLERLIELLVAPSKKSADTAFLVQVLHLVNPNDEIFARDYLYVKPIKEATLANFPLIDNSDGFFDNLPLLKNKGPRSHHQLRLTKKQRDVMKLKLYELRQAELAQKIA